MLFWPVFGVFFWSLCYWLVGVFCGGFYRTYGIFLCGFFGDFDLFFGVYLGQIN